VLAVAPHRLFTAVRSTLNTFRRARTTADECERPLHLRARQAQGAV